jgi:hypothetical protein
MAYGQASNPSSHEHPALGARASPPFLGSSLQYRVTGRRQQYAHGDDLVEPTILEARMLGSNVYDRGYGYGTSCL